LIGPFVAELAAVGLAAGYAPVEENIMLQFAEQRFGFNFTNKSEIWGTKASFHQSNVA